MAEKTKKKLVIVINNEKDDDWMKSLPGYKNEVEISKYAGKRKKELSQVIQDIIARRQETSYKHMPGQHNQKRHGWRYGSLPKARRSMRGERNVEERDEYRRRAGMQQLDRTPKPVVKRKHVEVVREKLKAVWDNGTIGENFKRRAELADKIDKNTKERIELERQMDITRTGSDEWEVMRNRFNNLVGEYIVLDKELKKVKESQGDVLLDIMRDVAQVDNPMGKVSVNYEKVSSNGKDKIDSILSKVSAVVSDDISGDAATIVRIKKKGGRRSDYIPPWRMMRLTNYSADDVIHEFGHHLEHRSEYLGVACKKFLKDRTVGEKLRRIPGYKNEFSWFDKFINPYMGKRYPTGETEILSMGLSMLFHDPMKLMTQDPEYFDFIVNAISGEL